MSDRSPLLVTRQRGVTMIEAAIALPVALLLIAGTIDFVRIFSIYTAMNYAAHTSVSDLVTIPQEEQTVDSALIRKYLSRGETFLTSVFLTTTPSRAQLVEFQLPTSLGSGRHHSAYLRPGEAATYVGGGATFAHPVTTGATAVLPWEAVFATHPVMVRIEADVGFLLLPLAPRRLTVSAYAYRRTRTNENFAPPPATPTSIPPSTSTPTPGPSPTPTQTPTPGPTSTPTATPCPCSGTACCGQNGGILIPECCQGGN